MFQKHRLDRIDLAISDADGIQRVDSGDQFHDRTVTREFTVRRCPVADA